ncbi:MAG TPA: hypothetical protein VG267_19340 [Terracidiphilus sp.]|nr:hypothetical protein [Terracidiphilus sp.]
MTELEMIRADAEMVVEKLRPLSGLGGGFGYNRASVEWVEGFIERQRCGENLSAEATQNLTGILGSFLGECVVRAYGGVWREAGGGWGVFFDTKNGVFPFSKVGTQFAQGVEGGDGILGFFETIDTGFVGERYPPSVAVLKGFGMRLAEFFRSP